MSEKRMFEQEQEALRQAGSSMKAALLEQMKKRDNPRDYASGIANLERTVQAQVSDFVNMMTNTVREQVNDFSATARVQSKRDQE